MLVLERLSADLESNPDWLPAPAELDSGLTHVSFSAWGRTGGSFHKDIGTETEEFHKK